MAIVIIVNSSRQPLGRLGDLYEGAKKLRYVTVRYGTLRYVTVRYGTLRYGTLRYGELLRSLI